MIITVLVQKNSQISFNESMLLCTSLAMSAYNFILETNIASSRASRTTTEGSGADIGSTARPPATPTAPKGPRGPSASTASVFRGRRVRSE